MATHFADLLTARMQEKGTCACVGLDPVFDRLPDSLTSSCGESDQKHVQAIIEFGRRVLEAAARHVAVVKLNVAFFEVYRGAGLDAYFSLVAHAVDLRLVVIGDVKRGDIGHSSTAYARAHLGCSESLSAGKSPAPHAVTVSAYLGIDGVRPFIEARGSGGGVFVLVHTSNESAGEIQHVRTDGGGTMVERVAELVAGWASEPGRVGASGYSSVGAVVAPGDTSVAQKLRTIMPHCIFLVPGFGAQGRSIEQVAACFNADGHGAIINASRSIIYAYQDSGSAASRQWYEAVDAACGRFVQTLRDAGLGPSR